MSIVKDRMSAEFATLASDTLVSSALRQLNHGGLYALMVDDKDEPISIINTAVLQGALDQAGGGAERLVLRDLERWLPPPLRVPAEMSMNVFVDTPQVVSFKDAGVPGWLVEEHDHRVGILTAEQIDDYLATDYESGGPLLAPLGPGVTRLVPLVCATCSTKNEVPFFDRNRPPKCRNKDAPHGVHNLVPGWLRDRG